MNSQKKHWPFALMLGLIAFLLTFFIDWRVNLLFTSLKRGFTAFVLFFILGFISHMIIFYQEHSNDIDSKPNKKDNESKIDLSTGDQDSIDLKEIYQTSGDSDSSEFTPLEFVKMQLRE